MTGYFPRQDGRVDGATFFVSSRTGQIVHDAEETLLEGANSNPTEADEVERVLNECCEEPVQCYRMLDSQEVVTVFTNIDKEGTAMSRRRTVSQHGSRTNIVERWNPVQASATSDDYGMEFIFQSQPADAGLPNEDDTTTIQGSPGIARTRTRRTRIGRKQRFVFKRRDDKELLKERLEYHRGQLYQLLDKLGDNPQLRCSHWYDNGRTFAFASAFIAENGYRKAIVALLWHTRTRPHRACCVSFSLEIDVLTANCSCCHLLSQRKEIDSGCYHAQVCLENDNFTKVVTREIKRREFIQDLEDKGDTIFGESITRAQQQNLSNNLTVLLDRGYNSRRKLVTPWMFFMTFDVDLCLFAPVLKVKGKPYRCLLCRIPPSRRGSCGHEDSARKSCEALRTRARHGSSILTDLGFLNEHESQNEEEYGNQDQAPHVEVDETDIGNNTSVSVPDMYSPINVRRTILPCRGEWEDMIVIAKALKHSEDSDILVLDERNKATCFKCGFLNNKENQEGYARDIQLFTLYQGTHKVRVYDWWCHICGEQRYFSGRGSGVFPAQRNSAFTTELMYQWLEMTCFQGYSFRNAYQTTRSMQRAASNFITRNRKLNNSKGKLRKQRTQSDGRMELDTEDISRRRANDALREFIKLLDTNSSEMTSTYFSCNKCEVPLSASDCKELGLSAEEGKFIRRFKAVVIDGTASGILTELPSFNRNDATVPAPKSMSALYKTQKLVKMNPHRKVIKKLFTVAKHCFRSWKKKAETTSSLPSDSMRFWISKTGDDSIEIIEDHDESITDTECKVLQLFLCDPVCFCPKELSRNRLIADISHVGHVQKCRKLRNVFLKAKERECIRNVLRAMFSLTEGNPFQILERNQDLDESILSSSEGNQEIERNASDDIANEESNRTNGDGINVGQVSDQQNDTSDESISDVVDSDDLDEDEEEIYANSAEQDQQLSGLWVTLLFPDSRRYSQLLEATLLLLDFLLTGHVALPYVGSCSLQDSVRTETDAVSENSLIMMSFTEDSFKVHADLIQALSSYTSQCTGRCTRRTQWASPLHCECITGLRKAAAVVFKVNPLLGTFCQELIRVAKPIPDTYKDLVASLVPVLNDHMETARKFFVTLEKKSSEQSKTYWRTWSQPEGLVCRQTVGNGDVDPTRNEESDPAPRVSRASSTQQTQEDNNGENGENRENNLPRNNIQVGDGEDELKESQESGICFPGRKRRRPCIVFKSKNEEGCRKKYKASNSHSPGLLTVQCACDSAKLIGFVVMMQAESTSLALSAVLSHFRILPRTVYYDNACNLFLSTMLRVPWVLGHSRFLVDRFHFKSHTCSPYFDPDSYAQFDSDYTETAESINARIEKTLHQIRYLKGDHLIPFLRARFSFINLAASFRATYHKDDLEDVDLTQFFQESYKCSCFRCEELQRELQFDLDESKECE